MRAVPHSIAYPVAGRGSVAFGYGPVAGFSSIAYRLANVRISRLAALLAVSALFYIS